MAQTKDVRIEAIRCFAAFLVVLNHSLNWCQFYQADYVFRDIVMCLANLGVPLFVMLSGYLLLGRTESLAKCLKRVIKIIYPLIFWTVVYLLFQKFVPLQAWQYSYPPETITLSRSLAHQLLLAPAATHLWYLYYYIGLILLLPILRVFVQAADRRILLYAVVLTALYMIERNVETILGQQYLNGAFDFKLFGELTAYLLLGLVIRRCRTEQWLPNYVWPLCLVSGALIAGVELLLLAGDTAKTALVYAYGSPVSVLLSAGVFGTVCTVRSKGMQQWLRWAILFCGDKTFGIYLCHIIFMWLVSLTWVNGINMFCIVSCPVATLCVCMVVLLLSLGTVWGMQKIPVLRRLV